MKRLFKRSLALLLALTMVLGNTLSMTSAATVSVRGNADPRIVARAEAKEEENTGTQEKVTPETPEKEQEEVPEQELTEPEENGEPTDPEKPAEDGNEEVTEEEEPQDPVENEEQEPEEPEVPEEEQEPEDPEQENAEEENPEVKDPEEQDPDTETPDEEDPEVQDPDAQEPAEDGTEQEEEKEEPETDPAEDEEQTPEIFDVTYELYPEEGGKINVSTTVKEGYTLGFNIKVYEGYELSSVSVSGETLNYTHVNEETGVYYFKKEAIEEAPVIEVYFDELPEAENGIKLMNMAMLLRVGEETVPADNFEIYKDGTASGEKPAQDIVAGDFKDNAPDLSSEQLYFDHAEVNGTRVYSVGMLDDIVYYGSLTGSLTILEAGEKIELHYVTEYTVNYDDHIGTAEGSTDKVEKGGTLSFYVTPSARGKRILVSYSEENGRDDDISDTGRVVDSSSGRTLFEINNIQGNVDVTISEEDVNSYTFTYDESHISNGTINYPASGETVNAGGEIVFQLSSSKGILDWGNINQYHLNKLEINGEDVAFPYQYPEKGTYNYSETTQLSSGETVTVELTRVYAPDLITPNRFIYEYKVTISNVYTDIAVTNVNFKLSERNEIILRQLDGVENIVGWDNADREYLPGQPNKVYEQTTESGNEFYFNLLPGYAKPQLKILANGTEHDEVGLYENIGPLYDGRPASFTYDQYKWRFDIGNDYGDNVEVYITSEPIEFTVTYVNDKNQDDVIGQPEGGYSVIEGSKDVLTITSRTPYITDPDFYADGWVVRGDTSGHVYHAGDNVNIEDIAQYASRTNTIVFYPNWVDINNGEQRNVSVNIYIEDPLVTGSAQVLAGQYNETVSKDGRGILEVEMEQAKDIIAEYLADKGIAIYNSDDYEIRDGENVFIVEETDQSIDVHFDLRKAELKVNFEWGSAEDEPADGSATLPQTETISAAIMKPYTYSYSDGTIPEGYMAANDISISDLNRSGAELTIYLYKDADEDSIPDTQSIELQFKANSATVNGTFSTYDGVVEGYDPALTDLNSVLTYELLKEYKEYSLKQGKGQAVTTTKSGQNYPSVPETIAADAGYERVRWNLDGGSALYGSYATLPVEEDAIDVSFTAEYDVKYNYHRLTVKYVDHDEPQKELRTSFTGLVAEGQKVQYPIPVISGYTNPDEKTYKDYIGTASDETITVEYYADADGNGKPDEFTIEIVFEGTGHGSWDNTWTNLEQGKDYKVSRVSQDSDSPMQLIVYLVKENDAGFKADEYPAVPGVNADTYYIFDHWDNKDSKGKEYGTAEDDTLVGSPVLRDAVDRNYISLYFNDKDNSGTPDVKEYITVIFKAGTNGKLIDDGDGSEKEEIRKENFLPGYDRYPAAPAVNPDTDYIFTGWDKTYNAGDFIQDQTKEQVFTAQYYEDLNHNDKPDWQEYVTVTFDEGDYGSIDIATDGKVAYNKLLPGKDKYPAAPQVVPDNGYAFTGWDPVYDKADTELNETDNQNQLYIAQYGEDANGDKVPDANQITVTFRINEPGISFKKDGLHIDGKKIVLNTDGTELTYWLTKGVSDYPSAPDKDDLNIPAEKKLALAAWEDASGQEYALSGEVKADAAVIYTAEFGKDEDGDGVVDPDEPVDPDDPGHGGDTDPDDPDHGGDTPGGDDTPGGGDHGGSTGPTPVSITNSGNPEDNYYTVGVNGQWVHMDNADMNTPLDEAVPADATAIGAPEWHRWRFYLANGTMLYNQWGHIENPYAVDGQPRSGWFYFDENGLMRYGWYLDARSGDWYYMHSESDGMLGTMITGWHYDTNDGKWYYLDPATGAMKTGWQQIDGKWYYFNPTPVGETWTQDQSTSVWRFNGNTVRPYGSMYQNETTPDGYNVDANGVRQ